MSDENKEIQEEHGTHPSLSIRIPEPGEAPDDSATSPVPQTPSQKIRKILDKPVPKVVLQESEEGQHKYALFCQMDVLMHYDDGDFCWKEAARWIKYEERVEEGERWSKPYVATTSLHALFEIRRGLAEDIVVLDLDAVCMAEITTAFLAESKLSQENQMKVAHILQKSHLHQHRKISAKTHGKGSISSRQVRANARLKSVSSGVHFDQYQDESEEKNTKKMMSPYKSNKRLMRKIKKGMEVANILIGEVNFLTEPIMVFVRLAKACIIGDVTEISLPTRFVFILLGPPETMSVWEYEEVGRGMAALLNDQVFSELSYKAQAREDILDGVDEFIDDLTVLPPSIWDPATRLEPPQQTQTEDAIEARKLGASKHIAMPKEIYEVLNDGSGSGEDLTLKRTGKLFGGLCLDIKKRYKHYISDYVDGLHIQSVASIIFLYFACITPIVTFGGLLGSATHGYMGTMECMLSAAICGIFYHIFSGQPLTIVGATGPLLVFETILYQFCAEYHLDYMSFRFWIGMWTVFFLMLMVGFDLSALVRYITRFTEESFAVLISLIFIYESCSKLLKIWHSHPIHIHTLHDPVNFKCHCVHPAYIPQNLTSIHNDTHLEKLSNILLQNDTHPPLAGYLNVGNETHVKQEYVSWPDLVYEDCITYHDRIVVGPGCIDEETCVKYHWTLIGPACYEYTVTHSVPDVFFLCCFLFIGTFVIAFFLARFRNSPFFPTRVRTVVADFAVMIAIIICTGVDILFDIDTPKLKVPEKFETTKPERGWVVEPMNVTYWWLIIAAVVPALLATILLFLDQQITAVIVNRKEHKLKKGHGYHLDLFVLSILIGVCSALGLPWFVAATVRTITHVRSLIMESEQHAPGERPHFLGVREQRVTGICIHILIGLSVFLTSVLQHIPMAVLYGVFLYMGVSSLLGVQFIERLIIVLMPAKYQPDYNYLRHVRTSRVHIFTLIQLVCMIIMWVMKSIKAISMIFPLMILALCFIRKGLPCVFTHKELYWLDHMLPDEIMKLLEDRKKENGEGDDEKAEVEMALLSDVSLSETKTSEDLEVKKRKNGVWSLLKSNKDSVPPKKPRFHLPSVFHKHDKDATRRLSQGVIERYDHKGSGLPEKNGDNANGTNTDHS